MANFEKNIDNLLDKDTPEIIEIPSDQVNLEIKREKDLENESGPCDLSGEPLSENNFIIMFSSDINTEKNSPKVMRDLDEFSDHSDSCDCNECSECSTPELPEDITIAIINKILNDKIMVKPLREASFKSTKEMVNTFYNVSNNQIVKIKEAHSYEEAVAELYNNTDYYNILREMFFLNKLID